MNMQTDYNKCQVDQALNYLQNFSEKLDNSIIREPQGISEILPVVLSVLKEKKNDLEALETQQTFYYPEWVCGLLNKLYNEYAPLSNSEYKYWKRRVSLLEPQDFKVEKPVIGDYIGRQTNLQTINDLVKSLKQYFHII